MIFAHLVYKENIKYKNVDNVFIKTVKYPFWECQWIENTQFDTSTHDPKTIALWKSSHTLEPIFFPQTNEKLWHFQYNSVIISAGSHVSFIFFFVECVNFTNFSQLKIHINRLCLPTRQTTDLYLSIVLCRRARANK